MFIVPYNTCMYIYIHIYTKSIIVYMYICLEQSLVHTGKDNITAAVIQKQGGKHPVYRSHQQVLPRLIVQQQHVPNSLPSVLNYGYVVCCVVPGTGVA